MDSTTIENTDLYMEDLYKTFSPYITKACRRTTNKPSGEKYLQELGSLESVVDSVTLLIRTKITQVETKIYDLAVEIAHLVKQDTSMEACASIYQKQQDLTRLLDLFLKIANDLQSHVELVISKKT